MSDGEPPVLSYFATSQDSASWLGGYDDGAQDVHSSQEAPISRISSDGALSFASVDSHCDAGLVDDGVQSRMTSGGDSDQFHSAQAGFECDFGGGSALDSSASETNPFLLSPLQPCGDRAVGSAPSGIDAYFGNAADNWLGDSAEDHSWLASPEQQGHDSAPHTAPAQPPPLRPIEQMSPVTAPALYSVPALNATIGQAVQPRMHPPPPFIPAKPDGFVSPSKFFPPSPAPSNPQPVLFRQPSCDDPVLKKNYPEGRCCGATWIWGGKLFVFSNEYGMQKTHSVALHACGKRPAFQASVARIKAWPGCDAAPDAMAKFLNDLKTFKIEDHALELSSPFQDSFDALTTLLSLLLTRGAPASQQHFGDILSVFDDGNSFSDSMNLISNIDSFRPLDPVRDLFHIQQLLLEGKCDLAIEHAMQSDLWAEAMTLAQFKSDSAVAHIVQQRLTERCLIPGTPLWFLHALKSGIVPEGPNLHSHWRLSAKILLQNRFPNSSEGLRALARAVLAQGDACAWIVLNASAAVLSKDKQQHVAAANFATPPAADIADLRDGPDSLASIRTLKAKDSAMLSDQEKRLVASEREISAKFEELKARAPCKEPHQGTLFYGYSTQPCPALLHPTTCERAEIFAAAFAGKGKGHMVRGLLYWRFMHAMWMADHGLHADAVSLFQNVQKRGNEVDYEMGKWLSRCAEMAILRLEHGKTPSTPASSGGSSLFGGLGSFVDSTVKFLVTGADAPAAPVKKPDSSSDRSAAPQPAVAASTSGPKVTFFNPHAGRQQIAQQLHQQPAQHVQPKPVSTNDVTEHNQARAAPETAAPPASPPPKLDRSSSDPVKSDAAKGATVSPGGEKQKGKSGWGIGSFIGGIVSKVLPASKGVEVDLGEESTMYYNEKLGRYVERGKEDEAAASANVAPPPVVAAWSQPAPAVASHPQPGPSEDNTLKMPGVGAPNAADVPSMSAPAVPQLSSGPPMPTGAARVAAPPSSSALGKSRYAVAGVAVTPASAPASSSPAPAARPRPQYKVFVPQAAAAEDTAGAGDAGTGAPS